MLIFIPESLKDYRLSGMIEKEDIYVLTLVMFNLNQ